VWEWEWGFWFFVAFFGEKVKRDFTWTWNREESPLLKGEFVMRLFYLREKFF